MLKRFPFFVAFLTLAACNGGRDQLPAFSLSGASALHRSDHMSFGRTISMPMTSGGPAAPFVEIGNGMFARSISDATQVTGCANDEQAVLYSAGNFTPLSVKGETSPPVSCGSAIASPGLGKDAIIVGAAEFPYKTVWVDSGVIWTGTSGKRLRAFEAAEGTDSSADIAGSDRACAVENFGGDEFAVVQPAGAAPLHPFGTNPCTGGGPYTNATSITREVNGDVISIGCGPQRTTHSICNNTFFYDATTGRLLTFSASGSGPQVTPSSLNIRALSVGSALSNGYEVPVAAQFAEKKGQENVSELHELVSNTAASSVNDYNVIVGVAYEGSNLFRWLPQKPIDGGILPEDYKIDDLSRSIPAGWSLTAAQINNHDQILGTGSYDGSTDSFILSLYRQAIDVSYPAGSIKQTAITGLLNTGPYWNLLAEGLLCSQKACKAGGINPYAFGTLNSASSAHMPASVYVILNFTNPGGKTGTGKYQMQLALKALCTAGGKRCIDPTTLSFMAIDVECGSSCKAGGLFGKSTPRQIQSVINDAVAAAPKGLPIVIYTARSQWNNYLGSWGGKTPNNPYRVCPLWDAVPDDVDDLNETTVTDESGLVLGFAPRALYGGWKTRFAKQYEFNNGDDAKTLEKYFGIKSLDLDTFAWNYKMQCVGGNPPR